MQNKNKMILGTSAALVLGLLAGTYLLSGLNKTTLAQVAPRGGMGRPEGIERACSDTDYQALQTAIDNKDYQAWKELRQKYSEEHQGRGGAQWDTLMDSQDKFEKFVDMKKAMESGDYETAAALKLELGFQRGMGRGMGRGMHRTN